MPIQAFKIDMEEIRKRARAHMSKGAVTSAYGEDVDRVVAVLQEVLATEIVCELRYRAHYYAATGLRGEIVKPELLEHANEERAHAERVAERIDQLGALPNFDPATLTKRSHAAFEVGADLVALLEEDLVAERVAVETYTEIVRWLGDADPTTRRLMESILAEEEHHADDLAGLLERVHELGLR
ncbi:MAG: bacterioferritin [Myxococcales bacterium]|nr:bacterioferritin [Myxococcales bacterium]